MEVPSPPPPLSPSVTSLWFRFPDGSILSVRREGSGIAMVGDDFVNEAEAASIMLCKAQWLFAVEAAGRC